MATKAILALMSAAALAGCASAPPPPINWTGGDPTRLASDKATCQKESETVDLGQANSYSDPKYGVAMGLAEAIDRDDNLRGHQMDARKAAFITCMSDKGWHTG